MSTFALRLRELRIEKGLSMKKLKIQGKLLLIAVPMAALMIFLNVKIYNHLRTLTFHPIYFLYNNNKSLIDILSSIQRDIDNKMSANDIEEMSNSDIDDFFN